MSNDNNWNWIQGSATSSGPPSLDTKGPIISAAGPKDKYLGRLVIEFYEMDGARSDADGVVYMSDATDGDHAKLARRVAAALATRIARNPN